MVCEHVFEDITRDRLKLIEKRELPGWAKVLIEKEDPKWFNKSMKWKTSKFLKCGECGLLKIVDITKEIS